MADRNGQPVTERTRVGLNTANIIAVRVAVEVRQRLEEGGQLLHRQEPKGGQRGVESTRYVAFGQDEAVALGIINGFRSDIEDCAIERREDVDGGKVATDVAGS